MVVVDDVFFSILLRQKPELMGLLRHSLHNLAFTFLWAPLVLVVLTISFTKYRTI